MMIVFPLLISITLFKTECFMFVSHSKLFFEFVNIHFPPVRTVAISERRVQTIRHHKSRFAASTVERYPPLQAHARLTGYKKNPVFFYRKTIKEQWWIVRKRVVRSTSLKRSKTVNVKT